MGRSIKKTVQKAAPIAGAVIGTAVGGPAGGAIGGAIGGGLSGGGIKAAGIGGLGGAAFGYAPAISGAAGLGAAGKAALTKGIQGAALGGMGGGAKGALMGAGLGSIGGYLGAGGAVPGVGSLPGASLEATTGVAGAQGPTMGSGILGGLGKLTGVATSAGAQPMKLGSLLQAGGNLLGYGMADSQIEEMRRLMEAQAGRAEQQFQPYSQAGQEALAKMQAPSMEALQDDPGYQFRLQEGNRALERSLAARGMTNSGAAMRAAQEYGQGLADQTYNDFFNRQGQIAGMGYGAASGLGSIYAGLGNAQAAALRAQIENQSRLFGGLGSLGGLF